jgi:hypothetical protein
MTQLKAYYTAQSPITVPGDHAHLFDALPAEPNAIADLTAGLVYHYVADEQFWGWKVPPERLVEVDTRYLPAMLARLQELKAGPLTVERSPQERLVGCCRDFSLLFTGIARQQGIPTRSRHGFADYFQPGYYFDHVIIEYWHADEQRWVAIDPELTRQGPWDFDVRDVPPDRFIRAGRAWQMCREEGADPDLFGLGPEVPVKGYTFIASRLWQDVAALNKLEMLCWDEWGLAAKQSFSEEDCAFIDRVAALTRGLDDTFEALRALWESDPRLQFSGTADSWTPTRYGASEPLRVTVQG